MHFVVALFVGSLVFCHVLLLSHEEPSLVHSQACPIAPASVLFVPLMLRKYSWLKRLDKGYMNRYPFLFLLSTDS